MKPVAPTSAGPAGDTAAMPIQKRHTMDKRPALGKGLSALIPDEPEGRAMPTELDIDRLSPNEFQPRIALDESKLAELVQ